MILCVHLDDSCRRFANRNLPDRVFCLDARFRVSRVVGRILIVIFPNVDPVSNPVQFGVEGALDCINET